MKTKMLYIAGIIIIALFINNGCSSSDKLTSVLRSQPIVVDGDNAEWNNVPVFTEKGKYTITLCNDENSLYFCFTTRNPQIEREMMVRGFTVWFDRKGGSKKYFGINFPMKKERDETLMLKEHENMGGGENIREERWEQSLVELEIVGAKESDRYRIPLLNTEGIKAKITKTHDGKLIYELQVPLKKNPQYAYAIAPDENADIGLGIETGEMEIKPEAKHEESGGFGGEGSEGGMGAGQGSGGRRHSGGGRREGGHPDGGIGGGKPSQIKQWFSVKLNQNEIINSHSQ